MNGYNSETIAILNKIDSVRENTDNKIDDLGSSLRSELINVTSEIAGVRDRLGTLEGENRGRDIELRDLKKVQETIEKRQEDITSQFDVKLQNHILACGIRKPSKGDSSDKIRRDSIFPKNQNYSPPKWVIVVLSSIGILLGGASITFVKSCESNNSPVPTPTIIDSHQ